MKVLVVGGGGREHALAWKAAQSDQVELVYVAPGNAGTATEDKLENVAIGAEDIPALKAFAEKENIDLTIIGPEAPLVAGIVDEFQQADLACFGPTKAGAILEGSKSFSKDFLKRHNIPTAEYEVFTEVSPAIEYVKSKTIPIVIKADGLAAGKGVVIALTENEAINAINDMLAGNKFGEAGHRVVVEEFMQGEEASFIVMSDGEHVLPLASSQDHKARDEGDKGPNTGGMGAYSPAPVVDAAMHDRIMNEVIMPTIIGMASEDRTYTGFLYAGVMITKDGTPKVLEFNCRFGDPETQPIMMRLKSNLVSLCLAATNKTLEQCNIEWDERAALGVVTASAGYPESASKGDVINGLDSDFSENVKVFHAGTANNSNDIVTAGGRVLCVTGLGDSVTQAQKTAYEALNKIIYEGMFYRKDIGYRAVSREQ
ncbi:MAG: phosphoribosylamine--glycine ligase [Proteobacteria bacterium]|nr:phosphoribosylamine--glycine ligase [Pseudomonadota bacterium]NOG60497.1 phosphoribosylamine--glycine ligase [Pseudomonadota bacterium]